VFGLRHRHPPRCVSSGRYVIAARTIVTRAWRFGSDLTDAEWTILEEYLPPCRHARKRKWSIWRIVEAMLDVLRRRFPICRNISRR
jgi:hypothetical protein